MKETMLRECLNCINYLHDRSAKNPLKIVTLCITKVQHFVAFIPQKVTCRHSDH